MGCLFEFLFEVVLEFFTEGITRLMCMVIPKHSLSKKAYKFVKGIVFVFSVLLLSSIFIGFMLILSGDASEKTAGYYMLFIPLGIIVIQITLGLVARKRTKLKLNSYDNTEQYLNR